MRQRNAKLRNDCFLASSAHLHSARVIVTRLRCFQNFLELIWREKWRVNRSRYCIIGEITRLFFFSKYLVLYFTHHFEKYVFYRNFEKYNAYVLLILDAKSRHVKNSPTPSRRHSHKIERVPSFP